jgi:hypothetical protein
METERFIKESFRLNAQCAGKHKLEIETKQIANYTR